MFKFKNLVLNKVEMESPFYLGSIHLVAEEF